MSSVEGNDCSAARAIALKRVRGLSESDIPDEMLSPSSRGRSLRRRRPHPYPSLVAEDAGGGGEGERGEEEEDVRGKDGGDGGGGASRSAKRAKRTTTDSTAARAARVVTLKVLPVAELKRRLTNAEVGYADCIEKGDLVTRLVDWEASTHTVGGGGLKEAGGGATKRRKKRKKRRRSVRWVLPLRRPR